jgi:hypothetical protein
MEPYNEVLQVYETYLFSLSWLDFRCLITK